jgi:hypothetical protein
VVAVPSACVDSGPISDARAASRVSSGDCSAKDGWILRGSAVTELFGVLDGFLVADLD